MKHPSRALYPLVSTLAPALLAVALSACGASVQKVKTNATVPSPVEARNSILDLPLAPIVPAAQRLCAARTPSGLGYTILRAAEGPKPAGTDTVLINYVGYLASTGAVFDQGMGSPLPVGGVIPGFSEGLQMMGKTGVVRLCIPAAMGYGEQASGPIPANSDLVFQVELLDFKTAAELEEMRKAQAADPASQEAALPQQ